MGAYEWSPDDDPSDGDGGTGRGREDREPVRYLSAERIRAGERAPWLPERPEELIRADLGRAVRLHPDLYVALRAPEPRPPEPDQNRS